MSFCRSSKNYGKTKQILVWENGDFHGNGHCIAINPNYYRTWNGILSLITNTLKPSFGAVRYLIHLESKEPVRSFESLQPNEKYIAVGNEKLKHDISGYKTLAEKQDVNQAKNILPQASTSGTATRARKTILFVMTNGKTQEMPCKVVITESDIASWGKILDYIARSLDIPEGITKIDLKRVELSADPPRINDPVIPSQRNTEVAKSKSEDLTSVKPRLRNGPNCTRPLQNVEPVDLRANKSISSSIKDQVRVIQSKQSTKVYAPYGTIDVQNQTYPGIEEEAQSIAVKYINETHPFDDEESVLIQPDIRDAEKFRKLQEQKQEFLNRLKLENKNAVVTPPVQLPAIDEVSSIDTGSCDLDVDPDAINEPIILEDIPRSASEMAVDINQTSPIPVQNQNQKPYIPASSGKLPNVPIPKPNVRVGKKLYCANRHILCNNEIKKPMHPINVNKSNILPANKAKSKELVRNAIPLLQTDSTLKTIPQNKTDTGKIITKDAKHSMATIPSSKTLGKTGVPSTQTTSTLKTKPQSKTEQSTPRIITCPSKRITKDAKDNMAIEPSSKTGIPSSKTTSTLKTVPQSKTERTAMEPSLKTLSKTGVPASQTTSTLKTIPQSKTGPSTPKTIICPFKTIAKDAKGSMAMKPSPKTLSKTGVPASQTTSTLKTIPQSKTEPTAMEPSSKTLSKTGVPASQTTSTLKTIPQSKTEPSTPKIIICPFKTTKDAKDSMVTESSSKILSETGIGQNKQFVSKEKVPSTQNITENNIIASSLPDVAMKPELVEETSSKILSKTAVAPWAGEVSRTKNIPEIKTTTLSLSDVTTKPDIAKETTLEAKNDSIKYCYPNACPNKKDTGVKSAYERKVFQETTFNEPSLSTDSSDENGREIIVQTPREFINDIIKMSKIFIEKSDLKQEKPIIGKKKVSISTSEEVSEDEIRGFGGVRMPSEIPEIWKPNKEEITESSISDSSSNESTDRLEKDNVKYCYPHACDFKQYPVTIPEKIVAEESETSISKSEESEPKILLQTPEEFVDDVIQSSKLIIERAKLIPEKERILVKEESQSDVDKLSETNDMSRVQSDLTPEVEYSRKLTPVIEEEFSSDVETDDNKDFTVVKTPFILQQQEQKKQSKILNEPADLTKTNKFVDKNSTSKASFQAKSQDDNQSDRLSQQRALVDKGSQVQKLASKAVSTEELESDTKMRSSDENDIKETTNVHPMKSYEEKSTQKVPTGSPYNLSLPSSVSNSNYPSELIQVRHSQELSGQESKMISVSHFPEAGVEARPPTKDIGTHSSYAQLKDGSPSLKSAVRSRTSPHRDEKSHITIKDPNIVEAQYLNNIESYYSHGKLNEKSQTDKTSRQPKETEDEIEKLNCRKCCNPLVTKKLSRGFNEQHSRIKDVPEIREYDRFPSDENFGNEKFQHSIEYKDVTSNGTPTGQSTVTVVNVRKSLRQSDIDADPSLVVFDSVNTKESGHYKNRQKSENKASFPSTATVMQVKQSLGQTDCEDCPDASLTVLNSKFEDIENYNSRPKSDNSILTKCYCKKVSCQCKFDCVMRLKNTGIQATQANISQASKKSVDRANETESSNSLRPKM